MEWSVSEEIPLAGVCPCCSWHSRCVPPLDSDGQPLEVVLHTVGSPVEWRKCHPSFVSFRAVRFAHYILLRSQVQNNEVVHLGLGLG